MEWILMAFIYAGAFAKGDSVTLQAVPGFKTKEACAAAGKALEPLVKGTTKELVFACVPR